MVLINGFGSSYRSSSKIFWHSDHTGPLTKPFNTARIRRRDWLMAEANNGIWVWRSLLQVFASPPSVPACNCFLSSWSPRELTSGLISFYLSVWIILCEVPFLLYSCQRKDEVKPLMHEKKIDFQPRVGKIRHVNKILVWHCVCTRLAGIVSCLSQALNIYFHPTGASLEMQDAQGDRVRSPPAQ